MTLGRENTDAQSNLGVGSSNKVVEMHLAARPTGEPPLTPPAPRASFITLGEYLEQYAELKGTLIGAALGIAQAVEIWGNDEFVAQAACDRLIDEVRKYKQGLNELNARGAI